MLVFFLVRITLKITIDSQFVILLSAKNVKNPMAKVKINIILY